MNTEKMIWGLSLTPPPLHKEPALNPNRTSWVCDFPRIEFANYFIKRVGESLSLQFTGEDKVHFIHPETGELHFTLELPGASHDKYDDLHISSKGFVYQMIHKEQKYVLIGGRIINKQWNLSFETERPKGLFRPLSTHCGFHTKFEYILVLYGPTGHQVIIENCMEVQAQDDKLYSIEKNPLNQDTCFLTIRTLKTDSEVISNVERSIVLNVKKASFGDVCQKGQIILFTGGGGFSDISPIFVNLDTQEVSYSQHKILCSRMMIINTETEEVWSWDERSKSIWKVSSSNITLMGSMESSYATTLVHVDKSDRLYFVDIPF